MLLAAIEDDLRVEMVNRRMCDSAVGILYRLMTLYAPGGESEKSLLFGTLAWMGLACATLCVRGHFLSRHVALRQIYFFLLLIVLIV